jgi:hypothetical protein
MKRKFVPIFKENCPDIPDMRLIHFQAWLRPEEVAALCEDATRKGAGQQQGSIIWFNRKHGHSHA